MEDPLAWYRSPGYEVIRPVRLQNAGSVHAGRYRYTPAYETRGYGDIPYTEHSAIRSTRHANIRACGIEASLSGISLLKPDWTSRSC
jgi:hypothetical protein